jgi:hypothetical protein
MSKTIQPYTPPLRWFYVLPMRAILHCDLCDVSPRNSNGPKWPANRIMFKWFNNGYFWCCKRCAFIHDLWPSSGVRYYDLQKCYRFLMRLALKLRFKVAMKRLDVARMKILKSSALYNDLIITISDYGLS